MKKMLLMIALMSGMGLAAASIDQDLQAELAKVKQQQAGHYVEGNGETLRLLQAYNAGKMTPAQRNFYETKIKPIYEAMHHMMFVAPFQAHH